MVEVLERRCREPSWIHTVLADGSHVEQVLDLTDGHGAEVVFDFVGEHRAEADAWAMTRRAGSPYVIGYGGTVQVPTIDVISTERMASALRERLNGGLGRDCPWSRTDERTGHGTQAAGDIPAPRGGPGGAGSR
jgi:threonine dehydrogenase-like Zn-dependent dehydrogenase